MMLLGEEVHGATATLAAAGCLAEELTHHLPGRHTGAEGMHVVAIGAAEPVVLPLHGADHPGAHGLLAVVEVHETKHLAPVIHLGALVFKAPAQGHVAIQRQAGVPINLSPLGGHQRRQPLGMGPCQGGCRGRGIAVHCDVLTHPQARNDAQL